jgi:hypothetical protein
MQVVIRKKDRLGGLEVSIPINPPQDNRALKIRCEATHLDIRQKQLRNLHIVKIIS